MPQGDRVVIGNNFVFRYHFQAAEKGLAVPHNTWAEAMEELNKKQEER